MDNKGQTMTIEEMEQPEVVAEVESTVESEMALAPHTEVHEELAVAEDEDSEDSLTFSNGVIEKIVSLALREVPGAMGTKSSWLDRVHDALASGENSKGVSVEVAPDNAVKINISVVIEYGVYAPQVFEDVKHEVTKQIFAMTGLSVAGINLRIEDVLTAEEMQQRRAE